MTWQIFITVSIFFSALLTISQKVLMRQEKTDPLAAAFLSHLITSVVVGVFVVVSGQLSFSGVDKIIPNLILLMVLLSLFYVLIFTSLKTIDASVFIVILSLKPMFTILASTALLKEGLSGKQFFGFCLVLAAVILVTLKNQTIRFGKGEFLALLAAAVIGFVNTNDRIALGFVNLWPYILLSNLLPLSFLGVLNLRNTKNVLNFFEAKRMTRLVIMCLLQLVAVGTMLAAFQLASNSSHVASLLNFSIIVTVLLGVVFLKETDNLLLKFTGVGLSLVGLFLIG